MTRSELFAALDVAKEYCLVSPISESGTLWSLFAGFEAMIFKEESILLMICWRPLARTIGSSLRKKVGLMDMPSSFRVNGCEACGLQRLGISLEERQKVQVILPSNKWKRSKSPWVVETPEGQLTITFTPKKKKKFDRKAATSFYYGFLSVGAGQLDLEHHTDGIYLC